MADETVLPNFFVVGATKAGTTSLYHLLKQHPEVFVSHWKEPGYFAKGYCDNWETYINIFKPGYGKKAIGDTSTQYLTDPMSAQRIRDEVGDVKIIIILRNPVDRCFSLYKEAIKWGSDWIPTFDEALREEKKRLVSQKYHDNNLYSFWENMYFNSGLYFNQVRRFLNTFSNVKIHLFDDLVNKTDWFYRDICNFLDVDDTIKIHFKRYNPARTPMFIKMQYHLRAYFTKTRNLRQWYRPAINKVVMGAMNFNVSLGKDISMTEGQRSFLKESYREDVLKLSDLIVRDLSHWMN